MFYRKLPEPYLPDDADFVNEWSQQIINFQNDSHKLIIKHLTSQIKSVDEAIDTFKDVYSSVYKDVNGIVLAAHYDVINNEKDKREILRRNSKLQLVLKYEGPTKFVVKDFTRSNAAYNNNNRYQRAPQVLNRRSNRLAPIAKQHSHFIQFQPRNPQSSFSINTLTRPSTSISKNNHWLPPNNPHQSRNNNKTTTFSTFNHANNRSQSNTSRIQNRSRSILSRNQTKSTFNRLPRTASNPGNQRRTNFRLSNATNQA